MSMLRCCGGNHELQRILKTGKVMECLTFDLKELCGATDTTVLVADERQVEKGLQNPIRVQELL